jgi:DNA-binding NtrC family response regulator
LLDYAWPGNVRELENAIERAVVLSNSTTVGVDLLPKPVMGELSSMAMPEPSPGASLFDIMEECERRIIATVLEKHNWNQTEAAETFRVPLSTLNQKIKRLNIELKKRTRD